MKEVDEAFFDPPSIRSQLSKKSFINDKIEIKESKLAPSKLIEEYIIKETIGKGTFSTVKLGEHIKTKKKVAIKILDKEKLKTKEDSIRIQREIKILSIMDHPNIIKTYKITETAKNYYIIMEYCEGGELFDYIVEKERLDESEASIFFYQLINSLEYIHSKGIAHRDLKPENLLLTKNKKIKIIDFGLSNYFGGDTSPLQTPCGSPSYASPEIIRGELYNGFRIDIWASGIILFAMLCGYLPFDEEEEENEDIKCFSQDGKKEEKSEDNEILFQKILEGKIDYPDYLSDIAVDLIKKMLVVEPEDRIKIKDIKKHKFYLLGQKNYFLYQKNITEHEIIDNLNYNNDNINMSDNSNSNIIDGDKINSIDLSLINSDKKVDKYNENNKNTINSNDISKNEERSNILKKEEMKNEMEEYEKKLFANYLKKVSNMKKKNMIINKNKKNEKNKNKKEKKKNLIINIMTDMNNKNNKKFSKYKNNYTLNEIVLNFNPIESYKNISQSSSRKYTNNNNSYDNKYNIPIIKLNPIKLKSSHNYISKYNNYNILNQNLNTLDIYNKRSKTKNKFLKEINHYLINNNRHIDERKENIITNIKNKKISSSQRYQKNKPILPIIQNNKIKQNKDIYFNHVLTEANNKNIGKKIIFNNWNKYSLLDFRNNINLNAINLKEKFKFSYPNSYKKYNLPRFNGAD
jgi:serine/threonine protein kinase